MNQKPQEDPMTRISMIALILAAFVFGACSNPRLSASGDQDAGSQNNNVNNNVNPDPDPDPDPDSPYAVRIMLESSDQLAVWLETQDGEWVFGPNYTAVDCPDGPKYLLECNPTCVFTVAAGTDLKMSSNVDVKMHYIDPNPANSLNFWDFEQTLNNLWLLLGYWEFNFFPDSEAQAEGFELGTSAFICALELDMLNLGCSGEIERDFFLHDGTVREATYTEGDYMPIVMFGLVENLNKNRRSTTEYLPPIITRID
ncbi:hypothetical protein ACFL3T_04340 [Patescibacteria group bacterium]